MWQFLWRFVAGGFSEVGMSKALSFRIGKVIGYRRGQIWYLCYHENGIRRRPRVGPVIFAARQLAAQVNGQLVIGAPAALSFEPVSLHDLRKRWLEHHEHVLRSSVHTIHRYRTGTEHLFRFVTLRPIRNTAQFQTAHAEEFVRYALGRSTPAGSQQEHDSKYAPTNY